MAEFGDDPTLAMQFEELKAAFVVLAKNGDEHERRIEALESSVYSCQHGM